MRSPRPGRHRWLGRSTALGTGGGLIAGVAAAVKLMNPSCLVFGVEPEGADSMHRYFAAGEPRSIEKVLTISDSLGARARCRFTFELSRQNVDDLVLVSDDELRAAMRLSFLDAKLAVESAGSAALAALVGPMRDRLDGAHVGLIVCGSNIDMQTYQKRVSVQLSKSSKLYEVTHLCDASAVTEVPIDREAELVAIDGLLAHANHGLRVLTFEGPAGIGKTTIWREALARAAGRGYRVLACRSAHAETRLSFAALSDLLSTIGADEYKKLSPPQRRAIDIALLRVDAGPVALDARAIGTAIVSILTTLSAGDPVLLAIDDAQWLDAATAHAIEFALRRCGDLRLAVVATVRTEDREGRLPILESVSERVHSCPLGPLSRAGLQQVLVNEIDERSGVWLTRPMLLKIERASGGNPFYALEIAREYSKQRTLRGRDELPVPGNVRDFVTRRFRRLPARTREALLRASALADSTVTLVDPTALAPAERAGFIRIESGGRVRFAHPLFAAAVYDAAPNERRRRLHGELAGLVADTEERARHLHLSSPLPDERIAELLETAADHARLRGATAAAAELFEHAAAHTPREATEVRFGRMLLAAKNCLSAGDRAGAKRLAQLVVDSPASRIARARGLQVLAEVEANDDPGAALLILRTALTLTDDAIQIVEIRISLGFMELSTLQVISGYAHLEAAVELAEHAGDDGLLAEALAMRCVSGILLGYGIDDSSLVRSLALESPERTGNFYMRASMNVAVAYSYTCRPDLARPMLEALCRRLELGGFESDLAFALTHLSGVSWFSGQYERAEREADAALEAANFGRQDLLRSFALTLRSMTRVFRGNLPGAFLDASEGLSIAQAIGWPHGQVQATWALGLVALARDDVDAAMQLYVPLAAAIVEFGVFENPMVLSAPDIIEAFIAAGRSNEAEPLILGIEDFGRRFDRPWNLAIGARCRALFEADRGDLVAAQLSAELALDHHDRLPLPFERARTLFVLGQLRRRANSRRAAKESLIQALAIFDELGTPIWATKVRIAITRLGVRHASDELTENERLAADLALQGRSNREIAAQLFMSLRTVESNLARAYRKLGVAGRSELIARKLIDTQ
jgi:DNA-binding CsgD family transcriptional regulator